MATIVTVRLLDDTGTPQPIEGVLVELYDDSPFTFVTSGSTDPSGEVVFDVPDDTYNLYFFKQGVSVLPRQPQQIVVDVGLSNVFEVTANVRTLPTASDPLLCRVTGTVKGVGGQPSQDIEIVFEPIPDLVVLNTNLMIPHGIKIVRPNSAGEFDFTLFRNIEYTAYFRLVNKFLGQQPPPIAIQVPNQSGISLETLLFPVQLNAAFSQATLGLTVGDDPDDSTDVTITWSDGSTRETVPWSSLSVSQTVDDIVEAYLLGGALVVKPIAAGSTVLSVARTLSAKAVFDPVSPFTSDTLTVTVT